MHILEGGSILGASQVVVEMGGGRILGGRGIFSGRSINVVEKGSIFWEGGVDSQIGRHISKNY